ncbi:DDE-type integrase/transposase/recombinase, partial [Dysosmobacter welbionis]
ATAVGNLVHEIGLWLSSMELPYNYTISLQTTSEPYGLTIHFDSVTAHVLGVERDIDKRMYAIAPSLLALIGNLGQVQWTYAAPDGTAVTRSVTLEEVDQALPDWIEAYNLDAGADWTAP